MFPMIPVTLAFFSGQAAGRVGYATWLGVVYVAGMSLMYAILGLVAARTGAILGSWLQHPLVLIGLAGLVTALALSMFGLYELRPPRWVTRRLGEAKSGTAGALVMGLTVGLIAAPCIGPFILGLLVFVSELANPWAGFGIFLTLGLGMGLPYVFVGALANQMSRWPKAGAWLVWIKRALGVVLIGLALYFLKPVAASVMPARPEFSGAGGPAAPRSTARAPVWQPYTPQRLEQALQEGRPVLVDIYADWCLPCVEMDHVTFRHPEVVQALESFATLRVDATQRIPPRAEELLERYQVPPHAEELLERYQVFGVPTLLVFDAQGRERPDLRINGFVTPKELLTRLAEAREPL
ncbi:MAG: thioredoxin family protein [Candidatus Omnitrophica bacterium]|nr:thioredoxin family protein [Candidatus Omnitrophota bacterium]